VFVPAVVIAEYVASLAKGQAFVDRLLRERNENNTVGRALTADVSKSQLHHLLPQPMESRVSHFDGGYLVSLLVGELEPPALLQPD
jgi:hypothetical protein